MKNLTMSPSTNCNLYNNYYGNNHDNGTQHFYLTSLMIFSISDLSKQSQNDEESWGIMAAVSGIPLPTPIYWKEKLA